MTSNHAPTLHTEAVPSGILEANGRVISRQTNTSSTMHSFPESLDTPVNCSPAPPNLASHESNTHPKTPDLLFFEGNLSTANKPSDSVPVRIQHLAALEGYTTATVYSPVEEDRASGRPLAPRSAHARPPRRRLGSLDHHRTGRPPVSGTGSINNNLGGTPNLDRSPADSGIRASLDAGMATMGRWIRSHTNSSLSDDEVLTADLPAKQSPPLHELITSSSTEHDLLLWLPEPPSNDYYGAGDDPLRVVNPGLGGGPVAATAPNSGDYMTRTVPHPQLERLRQRALSEPEVRNTVEAAAAAPYRRTPLPNVLRQRKRSGGGDGAGSSDTELQQEVRSRAFTTEYTSGSSSQSTQGRAQSAGTAGTSSNHAAVRFHQATVLENDAAESLSATTDHDAVSSEWHTDSNILDASTASTNAPLLTLNTLPLEHLLDSYLPAMVAASDSDGEVVPSTTYHNHHLYGARHPSRPTGVLPTPPVSAHAIYSSNGPSTPSSLNAQREVPTSARVNTVTEMDRERVARIRWIRINRRFQLVISFVAALFSVILFAILVCWVFLTSAYVTSLDNNCDDELKWYFWLATLQLVMDVFRRDIMRFVFRWDARSNERIPGRVVLYNIAYLIYALLVLRKGIKSVYFYSGVDPASCRSSTPDLLKVTTAYVSLSVAAWSVIVFGYLVPFCIVAAMLTLNGYNPNTAILSDSIGSIGGSGATTATPVFPAAYATSGAPPGCVDQLAVVPLPDSTADGSIFPRECCICMEAFRSQDVIVETNCRHMFHKNCCREWLRQARTCPVCRDDIPSALEVPTRGYNRNDLADLNSDNGLTSNNDSTEPTSIPIGPSGRPVAGFLRLLRHAVERLGFTNGNNNARGMTSNTVTAASSVVNHATTGLGPGLVYHLPLDLEAGSSTRPF
jgi:hypothetical protein